MTQKQLERELTKIYSKAREDLGKKWYDYFDSASKRIERTQSEYDAAVRAGDTEKAAELSEKLVREKQDFTLQNERYKSMVRQTTEKMANVNEIAAQYSNKSMPSFYRSGYNETIPGAAQAGIKFDMVDEATVRKLATDGDIRLPQRKIDIPKDERWNTKQINSNVLQGIIQGESMDKIAKRLEPIMDNNRKAAIRNARTLVNGAENAGRMDRAHELEQEGVILRKVWIATGDDRTRDIHLVMDGQEVDLDEPFVDGDGNELQYPCDPDAVPDTVYNCRCSYLRKVAGFRKADGSIREIDYEAETEKHKEEIEQEKERRGIEGDKKLSEAEAVVETAEISEQSETAEEIEPEQEENELTQDEWDAVEEYVSGEDMWLNNYLRGRDDFGELTEREKRNLELLDSATSKNPIEEKVLYRSVDAEAVFGKISQSEYSNLYSAVCGADDKYAKQALENAEKVVGKELVEKGFMSTTADKDVAFYWGDFTGSEKPIVLALDVEDGVCGVDVRRFEIEGREQDERLLQRNLKYEVTKIEKGEDTDGEGAAIFVYAKLRR